VPGGAQTAMRPHSPLGAAAWRLAQLRARGLHVVDLDGDLWLSLDRRRRVRHLQAKLAAVGLYV
jgi:hypothetical protein